MKKIAKECCGSCVLYPYNCAILASTISELTLSHFDSTKELLKFSHNQQCSGKWYEPNNPENAYEDELLNILYFHMKFNCATFDRCYKKDFSCILHTNKNNCRFIKSADLIEKITGEEWSKK